MRFNEGKNIRVSNEVHQAIVDHISEAFKIGKWVENAIKEKIERESKFIVDGKVNIDKAFQHVFPREYENLKTK